MDHPKYERSYVMIKPDGVQRSLIGDIISRIERTGLKLTALKMFVPTREKLIEHYGKTDEWYQEKGEMMVKNLEAKGIPVEKEAIEYGKGIIEALVKYMMAGPVVAMIIEGNQAVGIVKKLVGSTEPLSSDVGTIRGDLTIDSYTMANLDFRAVRNLIHCTDEPDESDREINLWMDESDYVKYRHINEAILYDVNIDGILE